MTEKRFSADGVKCILIWKTEKGQNVPFFRLYERGAEDKITSFKDYRLRCNTDPELMIMPDNGCFEFVEPESGECYFDFSLRVLGKENSK